MCTHTHTHTHTHSHTPWFPWRQSSPTGTWIQQDHYQLHFCFQKPSPARLFSPFSRERGERIQVKLLLWNEHAIWGVQGAENIGDNSKTPLTLPTAHPEGFAGTSVLWTAWQKYTATRLNGFIKYLISCFLLLIYEFWSWRQGPCEYWLWEMSD